MAARVAWGIDIGSSALKAVKVVRDGDEMEIESAEYIDFGPIPSGTVPAQRQEEALRELVGRSDVTKHPVALALPGQTALARFIDLPPVDASKIREMVGYEAQQQIPYDLEEVNWGYHEVGRQGDEVEVGIFAVKRDLVVGHLAEYKQLGVKPAHLTLTTLAVYNLLLHDNPPDTSTILLDIGAEHTDLVVVSGHRYWLRNLSMAGNDMTEAVADKMGCSFEQAEELKRNAGNSPKRSQILAGLAPKLKDLITQVQRSISYFRQQSGGGEIGKLVLIGDGSRIDGLDGYLQKNLGFDVERFERLHRITLGPAADQDVLARHLPAFAVSFGLGLQAIGLAENDVNLLPREQLVKAEIQRKTPLVAAAVAVLFLTVGLLYWFKSAKIAAIDRTIEQAERTDVEELNQNAEEIEDLQDTAGLREQIDSLLAPTRDRQLALAFATRLSEALGEAAGGNSSRVDTRGVQPPVRTTSNLSDVHESVHPLWLEERSDDVWVTGLEISIDTPEPAVQDRGRRRGRRGGRDAEETAADGADASPRAEVTATLTAATFYKGDDRGATYEHLQEAVQRPLREAFGVSVNAGSPRENWALVPENVGPNQAGFGTPHHYMMVTFEWTWSAPEEVGR